MKAIFKFILKLLGWILMIPVYFYKYAISPLTSPSCRHDPTCSQYAIDAIKIHGPFKGFWLGTKRIAKCHPWGTHGYDPVPPKKASLSKSPRRGDFKKAKSPSPIPKGKGVGTENS
jgi:uncharacterized protein